MASKIIRLASTPTIDILLLPRGEAAINAGGPGLYAAAAARVLGVSLELYGSPGYCTLPATEAERSLGARRSSNTQHREGAVFILDYRGGERTFTLASTPPPLALDGVRVDLLSPLYGEAAGLPAGRILAVDVQGFVRGGLPVPYASIVHYSRGELGFPPRRGLAVETNGPGPMRLYYNGVYKCSRLPAGRLSGDPTGAGDAFTLAYYYLVVAEGMEWCDALVEASKIVAEALPLAREARKLNRPPPCTIDCRTRVVMFDFDGTIINTMSEYADAAATIISKLSGIDVEEARRFYLATRGMAFPDQLRAAGISGADAVRAARLFEEEKLEILDSIRPDPVVVELLRRLRRSGVVTVLSTNNECSVVSKIAWLHGLFDMVLCYSPTSSKGAGHAWRVMREYGVEPCQMLFVGDGAYDLEVYSRLGVPTVETKGLWVPDEAEKLLSLVAEGGPLGDLSNILV